MQDASLVNHSEKTGKGKPVHLTVIKPKPKFLDQLREALRARHYSRRTEQTYCLWVKRFIFFHHVRHPAEMAEPEINAFLTHLAVKEKVSASTQNQALCALRATMFMETLGKQGLRELAWQNAQKAAYAVDKLAAVPGVKKRLSGPVFNEFAIELPKPWPAVDAALRAKGFIGGYGLGAEYPELGHAVLVAVTELRTKDEIDRLARALQEVLS